MKMGRCESCNEKIPQLARCPLCGHQLAQVAVESDLVPTLIAGAVILGGAGGVIALLRSEYEEVGLLLVGALLLVGWIADKVGKTRAFLNDAF